MIRGMDVTLLNLTAAGEWAPITVQNVLVSPLTEVDSSAAQVPDGRRALYHLAIPKADANLWEGQLVQFWNCTWSVIGIPTEGMAELIPGPWNRKVTVELYRTATPDILSLWTDVIGLPTAEVETDADGYPIRGGEEARSVRVIFTQLPQAEAAAENGKAGMRRKATVEIWREDYRGETEVLHDDAVYTVRTAKDSGRGTWLLELEEVWP